MGSLLCIYSHDTQSYGGRRGVSRRSCPAITVSHLAISIPLGTWREQLHFGTNRTNGIRMHVPLVPPSLSLLAVAGHNRAKGPGGTCPPPRARLDEQGISARPRLAFP